MQLQIPQFGRELPASRASHSKINLLGNRYAHGQQSGRHTRDIRAEEIAMVTLFRFDMLNESAQCRVRGVS